MLPIRWQPFEAIFEDDYSTKSDVYSFGALCWELFNQGEQPFFGIPDSTVTEKLQSQELKLLPPKNAPPKISNMLNNCTSYNPRERPTFSSIAISLEEALKDI